MKIEDIQIPKTIKSDFDGSKMALSSFVDITKPIQRPPIAISIGESHYKGDIYPIAFGSYGDYSCIVGSSKSKKTFLKSAILASYIGGNANHYFPNIKGYRHKDRVVIDIDTEQSKFHSQRVFRRVAEMVGIKYDNYYPFSIREYSTKERFEFIDWIMYESEYKNDIGLCSIDGYADLVTDFNNLELSNQLQEKLLGWTTKADCHITGILHKNFNSDKPVGHIGSAILKKAETVVFLENEDENVRVKCRYSRNIAFDDFVFTINNNWLPELINDDIF